ncbi:conserved hypothetical protein [Ricinus communis]|uniref:Uncharacterized protein n=1 Tax=Ricinus communis TaxID=3988 RepID=B9RZF0_RICCO|nr:conserved hypothetical protein [Ricinus communis]
MRQENVRKDRLGGKIKHVCCFDRFRGLVGSDRKKKKKKKWVGYDKWDSMLLT